MPQLIIARFNDQFAANAAVDKLLSQGLTRAQVVLQVDSSVGPSSASSGAPTTVISPVDNHGQRDDGEDHRDEKTAVRQPLQSVGPENLGHARVMVMPREPADTAPLSQLLKDAGAHSVTQREGVLPATNPRMWPQPDTASADFVQLAINASRGGATLPGAKG